MRTSNSREPAVPKSAKPGKSRDRAVPSVRYVYWQDGDMWLGYIEDYPDYMTQGTSLDDLQDNLKDIYLDIAHGCVPGVRRVAELQVS